jgi:3D (Asp-Asp-Asp) domain-containing protein
MGSRLRLTLMLLVAACAATPGPSERRLVVTASAYNSTPLQTDGDPATAAWGDRLEPGMRTIAVSRDLLGLGLRRGVRVRIDELPGEWIVLDKMASRWQRKIDIYMGEDVAAARLWGRRQVTIRWSPESD